MFLDIICTKTKTNPAPRSSPESILISTYLSSDPPSSSPPKKNPIHSVQNQLLVTIQGHLIVFVKYANLCKKKNTTTSCQRCIFNTPYQIVLSTLVLFLILSLQETEPGNPRHHPQLRDPESERHVRGGRHGIHPHDGRGLGSEERPLSGTGRALFHQHETADGAEVRVSHDTGWA